MKVLIVTLLFVISVVGNYPPPPKHCKDCDKICGSKPEHHKCKCLEYQSIGPCSYYCICDGTYYYHTVDDFTECGKDRYCYWGDCLGYSEKCPCDCHGDCYIGLAHPYNPCLCNCYNKTGCDVYQEYLPCGTCCFNEQCCEAGKCEYGKCIPNC
uniref:Egg case protein-like protein 2 n=1 Tax=Liphistius malayanus TaxID=1203467 RepID=I6UJL1_9ARAC|nr:egg case protein-like protein 2 [Liphistius malayanus]